MFGAISRNSFRGKAFIITISLLISSVFSAQAAFAEVEATEDLFDMSLESLMDMKVSIASKKPQKIADIAAAVHVVTNEDIRRSGATSIPEALRLVPGITVTRVDTRHYAITIRGQNDVFANKLLVLMDGRSVYTPLFAGTLWDLQDTLLEDIDRIEVIRGPGASVWGANAVNGVINIITKDSADTVGTMVSAGGGTEEKGMAAVRYGAEISEDAHFKVYSKWFDRDESVRALDDSDNYDGLESYRGGFRSDYTPDNDHLTLQGDIFKNKAESEIFDPITNAIKQGGGDSSGGNLLSRWSRKLSESSDVSLQTYWDRTHVQEALYKEDRDTLDFDFQHRFSLLEGHDFNWGFGYRWTTDEITRTETPLDFTRKDVDNDLYTAFFQDEMEIVNDLHLTVGLKFEENDYTGFEVQPTTRLLWTVSENQSAWTSFSKAVRTPSQTDNDIRLVPEVVPLPDGTPMAFEIQGNEDLDAEELFAYEAGYRYQTGEVRFDLAVFYNYYDNARVSTFTPPPLPSPDYPGFLVMSAPFGNAATVNSYGGELIAEWQADSWWKLTGSYSFIKEEIDLPEGSGVLLTTTPQHQFYLRSLMDLPCDFELDAIVRYASSISALALDIDPYWEMDLRLGWHATDSLELSVVGQNLFNSQHQEYVSDTILYTPAELERGVYGKATWSF